MQTLIRLKSVANVIHFWDFLSAAFEELDKKYSLDLDLTNLRKTLHWLVLDQERVWFSVVLEAGEPVGFAVVHDATPPFGEEKVWTVQWFYHARGHFEATLFLKKEFDKYASTHNISRYLVTTNRMSGGAIRCFQSEKFGFKKAYLTYEHKV